MDLRADLGALGKSEAAIRLIRQGEMRSPRDRECPTFRAEDDELEAEATAVVRPKVAGVVPPFGQPIMRRVVAREHDRLGVDRRRWSG